MRRAATILLLALGCFCSGVSTSWAEFAPVGQRDASGNAVVAATLKSGHDWLAARGLQECATGATGHVWMADDLGTYVDENGDAQRYGGASVGCDVWLLTGYVRDANSRRQHSVSEMADVLVHELAHTAGLSHEEMAASGFALSVFKAFWSWAGKVELGWKVRKGRKR